MVKLSIHSYRGNSNSRFFAHVGYLGLTPVKVDGVVRTKLDDDLKPLLASSVVVSVRCIELRQGSVRVVHSNTIVEYSQTLWTKPAHLEYAELANVEIPFKIVVPTKTPGFSCANFQDYRVFWRVEAVVNHAPIFGVGTRLWKSYDLPLLRYDTSIPRRGLLPSSRYLETRKPRAPVLRYHLSTPIDPVGPSDIVSIPITLHPVDPTVTIRGISLIVERRIQLSETTALPVVSSRSGLASPYAASDTDDGSGSNLTIKPSELNTPLCDPSPLPSTSTTTLSNGYGAVYPTTSTATLMSTQTADTYGSSIEHRPLLQPITTDFPAKTVSMNVHAVDSIGPFTRDESGVYTKNVTFQWPAKKPNSHWAMGETMQTELVSVRFFLHIKVIVSSSTTVAESIELDERELFLVSTNDSERKVATAKYQELYARSKSKSPKRSKRDQPLSPPHSPDGTVPSVPLVPHSAIPLDSPQSLKSAHASGSTPSKGLRRPHTSAGLRDKPSHRPHHRQHEHHEHTHHRRDEDGRAERDTDDKAAAPAFSRLPWRPGTAAAATASTSARASTSSGKPTSPSRINSFSFGRRDRGRCDREGEPAGREGRPWDSTVRTNSSSTSGYSSSSSTGNESRRGWGWASWASSGGGGGGDSGTSSGKSSRHHDVPASAGAQSPNSALSAGVGGGGFASDPGSVQAWEAELARIELQSRRVSEDMLGFKRVRTASSRPNTGASVVSSSATSRSGSP